MFTKVYVQVVANVIYNSQNLVTIPVSINSQMHCGTHTMKYDTIINISKLLYSTLWINLANCVFVEARIEKNKKHNMIAFIFS